MSLFFSHRSGVECGVGRAGGRRVDHLPSATSWVILVCGLPHERTGRCEATEGLLGLKVGDEEAELFVCRRLVRIEEVNHERVVVVGGARRPGAR